MGLGWDWIKAGVVNVLYGSADGLNSAGNQMWSQRSSGISDDIEEEDRFGFAVASGDFDGDGYADPAVGTPGESWGGFGNIGQIHVLFGGPGGLSSSGSRMIRQSDLVGGIDLGGDLSGWALAAGDFDRDGYADLAIGVPGEAYQVGTDTVPNAGLVHVIYGTSSGLSVTGSQEWTQNSTSVLGTAESDDQFGRRIAAIPELKWIFVDNFEGGDVSDWSASAAGD